jgi:hypothetical protein
MAGVRAIRPHCPPYDGITVLGWPVGTMIILSRHVMCKGEILEPAGGEPVRFARRSVRRAKAMQGLAHLLELRGEPARLL